MAGNPNKLELTTVRIAKAVCPEGKLQILLWDTKVEGLVVRIRSTGGKSYLVTYRPGAGGRLAPKRWVTLGELRSHVP